jgi:transmembrane sensor
VSSEEIEARAGEWLARRDANDWTEQDEVALEQWLDESTAHVVAFVRLEAAWTEAKRLQALAGGVEPGTVPSVDEWQLTRFFDPATDAVSSAQITPWSPAPRGRLRGLRHWAVAATVLIAVASVLTHYWPSRTSYSTPVGGIAAVPMSDGSEVTLNTDTKIRLEMTKTQRRVELQQGEAFFDVARDPSRPFIVTAGSKRVVAVGTKFSVRRERNELLVFVTEGRVRVEDAVPMASAHDSLLTLSAGSLARGEDDALLVQQKTVPEIERHLSWRTGYLIFRDTPLAEAVDEFNRYNSQRIVIDDPRVAEIRVSGKFRPTQYEAFVRLMQEGFSVRMHRIGGDIVLSDASTVRQ